MRKDREELLRDIWEAQDEAYDLMYEYDSLPHRYGDNTLYQSEAHVIDLIGENPEITVTEIAAILKKTASACSQIVRKLRAKGWNRAATRKITGFSTCALPPLANRCTKATSPLICGASLRHSGCLIRLPRKNLKTIFLCSGG